MVEPQASVAIGAAVGAGTVILGAQVDALAVGLAAAIFASIFLDAVDDKIKAGAAALLAAMLAGYGSPFAAAWAAQEVPALAGNVGGLRLLMAVLIGGVAPTVIPLAVGWMKRRSGQ